MSCSVHLTPRVKFYEDEVIYGPVPSRRLGYSLGINVNLSKEKRCNFDCVYCQLGLTNIKIASPKDILHWRSEEDIAAQLEKKLQALSKIKKRIDSITFSGYGEPALYPLLNRLILKVKKERDVYYPTVPVRILTNASLITLSEVYNAFEQLDYVVAKLDVGTSRDFVAINRPTVGTPSFDEIIQALARFQNEKKKIVIQTLIFGSNKEEMPRNDDEQALGDLIEKIAYINPLEVQVYTLARIPAESFVIPVEFGKIKRLASTINQKMGRVCARAYPHSKEQIRYRLDRIKAQSDQNF